MRSPRASLRSWVLLVGLCACGASAQECEERRLQAVQAWQDLGDYYTRMAAAADREVLAAQAELAALTAERERKQRAGLAWRSRQSSGLQSMRTGEIHRDPSLTQEYAGQARRAEGQVETVSDDEELAIGRVMELEARRALLLQKADHAEQIRAAVANPEADPSGMLAHTEALEGTELLGIARRHTEAMQAACD